MLGKAYTSFLEEDLRTDGETVIDLVRALITKSLHLFSKKGNSIFEIIDLVQALITKSLHLFSKRGIQILKSLLYIRYLFSRALMANKSSYIVFNMFSHGRKLKVNLGCKRKWCISFFLQRQNSMEFEVCISFQK